MRPYIFILIPPTTIRHTRMHKSFQLSELLNALWLKRLIRSTETEPNFKDTKKDPNTVGRTRKTDDRNVWGRGSKDAAEFRGRDEDTPGFWRTQKGRPEPEKDTKRTFSLAPALEFF